MGVSLVELFRDDKDVLSVLLSLLDYEDVKVLSSVDRLRARSPLRARMFAQSAVRLPFPPLTPTPSTTTTTTTSVEASDLGIHWSAYYASTFLRGMRPETLRDITSVAIPHSGLAPALAMLPSLTMVSTWSIPRQALAQARRQQRKRQQGSGAHRRRRRGAGGVGGSGGGGDELRRAARAMRLVDFVPLAEVLQTLHLHRAELATFPAIASLVNLRSLDLSETRLDDGAEYKHLGSLVRLEKLNLCGARVRHTGFLRRLERLRWLDVEATKISSLHDIAELEGLEYLNISDLWLQSGFIELPNARVLRTLLASYIEAVEPLTLVLEAPELQKCELRGSMVHDFTSLAHSTLLWSLDIRDTRHHDFEILGELRQLRRLMITADPQALRTIPWDGLAELDELHVEKWFDAPAEYEVIDGHFFASLPRLHSLHIDQLSDFSWVAFPGSSLKRLMMKTYTAHDEERLVELADCAQLDTLHIRIQHEPPPVLALEAMAPSLLELRLIDAVTEDFSALAACTRLEMLDLTVRETSTWRPLPQGVDFSFLERLTQLRVLWLTGRHDFKDVNHLRPLKRLEALRLDRTRITEAGGVSTLTNLKNLCLDATRITEFPDCSRLHQLEAVGIPTGMDCARFHVIGAFPKLKEIWHEEGYNCYWTGHEMDITAEAATTTTTTTTLSSSA